MDDDDNQDVECSPGRPERRDARENRHQILVVAKRLFATQGAAATTMKDIAQAAGVGKGTLYRHFAHKGELCGALIHEDLDEIQERVGALVNDREAIPSPLTRLELLIVERINITEWHLPLFAAIEEANVGAQRPGPFRGPFGVWTHTQIVRLLREAIEYGEVADLDVTFTADAMLAAMWPPLYRYQRTECDYSVDQIIAGMRRLYIDGLRQKVSA